MNISLRVFCEVDADKVQLLVPILDALIPYTIVGNDSYLAGVLIVSAEQLEETANLLISEFSRNPARYLMGSEPPEGIAVPIETDEGLRCFVFLTDKLVQSASADADVPPGGNIFSTIFEELLHVRHYGLIWQRRGYVQSPGLTVEDDVLKLCEKCHDEYVVARWKGTFPILKNDDGVFPLTISYGVSLALSINKAFGELEQVIRLAATRQLSNQEAWQKSIAIALRGIFDPLSRDAGFRAARPDIEHPNSDASRSPWFSEHIAPYWERIESSLNASFESDLKQADSELAAMTLEVKAFLEHIGIQYNVIDEQRSEAYFWTHFFDGISQKTQSN